MLGRINYNRCASDRPTLPSRRMSPAFFISRLQDADRRRIEDRGRKPGRDEKVLWEAGRQSDSERSSLAGCPSHYLMKSKLRSYLQGNGEKSE